MKKIKAEKNESYLETITDKVGEIAAHYGFTVVKGPKITPGDIAKSKQFKDFDYHADAEEKVALTNWYLETKLDSGPQPVAIHYKKPLHGHQLKKKPTQEMYGFEIIGSSRPTSEALLLKCALAILSDLGYDNICVSINSIGDRESIAKFERELTGYFRKNDHLLETKHRVEFKKNPYTIFTDTSAETSEFISGAPQPVGSLSEVGRLHFKEVLEAVEAFDVGYKIKPHILSNKLYASNTVFEIRELTDDKGSEGDVLAYGYRYNHLAKKIGAKREVPSVGMTIVVKKNPKATKKVVVKNIKKPQFYLVQLGNTAKLKALNVVEMLRKEKIPVQHSITKDKITGQLSGADNMKATHVLVMGQKEAIENTMIVRNVINREQETVSLTNLPNFLKNLNQLSKGKSKK